MKFPALACLLYLLPTLLLSQANDPVFDSLSHPLPAKASVRTQAEQLKNILQYILYKPEIGFGDYPRKLDSLNRCCITGKTGDWRFEMWVEAVSAYYSNSDNYEHHQEGIRILEKAIRQFEVLGDSNMVGAVLPDLCYYAFSLGDSVAFSKYHLRAIGVAPRMTDIFLHWRLLAEMGSFCKIFGKYPEGLAYYFEAYDLVEMHKTPYTLPLRQIALLHISTSYREFGEMDDALLYIEKAIQLGKENNMVESMYYVRLGDIHFRKKDYHKALESYQLAATLPDEPNFKVFNAELLCSQADCYLNLGDPKTALLFAQKATGMYPAESRVVKSAFVLTTLAECELALGMTDLALKHGLLAYDATLIGKLDIELYHSSKFLSRVYKAKGNFRKAFEFSEIADNYLTLAERTQTVQRMAGKIFERNNAVKIARREAEVKAQLEQQRNIRYALFAGLAVLALLAFLLYNRYRFKQRTNEQLETKNQEVEAARSRAEQERRRAEASEAFKSRFLANMSHEIRTPLHGISGFTDLLLETSLSEKQRRWLSSIHHSTDRLGEVVNDILDLSKLEAGEVNLRQIAFSPTRVAADVQDALSLRAENKGIELSLKLDEKVPDAVTGDPTRLYQILMNLTGNAVKFTEKGSVQLAVGSGSPHNVKLGRTATANCHCPLKFTVTDTGIGIPPEKLAAVFDSFQQAGEDTTARFGGTGLGLTIARELVQLHGSDIHVESEVGKGSVFSFVLHLPMADAADLDKESAAAGSLFFANPLRILLADDNALNREIATEAIRRHFENAEIVESVNGKEAVERLKNSIFDLVLMDMQMPEMTGTEATRHIRQHISADIPIIALTASATPEEIENALESGMNRHLGKPFKPRELAQVMAEVMGLKGSVPAALAAGLPSIPAALAAGTELSFLRDFCEGDEAQMQHFIQKFMQQCPVEITRLEAAIREKDWEGAYQAAHSFRPQLEFMGFKKATDLTMALEQEARKEQVDDTLPDLLAALKQEINTSLPTLKIA